MSVASFYWSSSSACIVYIIGFTSGRVRYVVLHQPENFGELVILVSASVLSLEKGEYSRARFQLLLPLFSSIPL